MSQGATTQESFIAVPPNQTMAGAQNVRQLIIFEYQPATNTYVQVQTQVVATADPLTGLTVRLATADQMDDVIRLLHANLRAQVATLNALEEAEANFEIDDFLRDDEDA